jgi:hypothetical protein
MTDVPAMKLLAVLIDGDNFSADLAAPLFTAVSELGTINILRVYGSNSGITGWRAAAAKYGIGLREVLPGKNATDMRLAIEAIDILHRWKVGGFCIVSSDSDFAELAKRLREDGVTVHGFGESKAAAGFRQACDSFLALDKPATAKAATVVQPPAPKSQPASKAVKASGKLATEERLRVLLLKAFDGLPGGGWHPLSNLLAEVRRLQHEFTAKAFGAKTPIKLVRKTDCFDDELRGGTMMVRRRVSAGKPVPGTKAA